MKKFLTYSVVAATMAWSMGISAVLPAAAATAYVPTDGDIVKVAAANRPGVYYIMGGKKYLFVNRVTYTTWASAIGDTADSFKGLKGITQAEFDALDLGGNITARAGASIIKFDNSDLVYAVAPGAKLCKLADTAAKTALYGAATPILIQSAFETGYTKDASCALTATSKYPDGTLIKSGTSYFYVEGGAKKAVDSSAFAANGFKESWAVTVADTSAYTVGSAITGKFVSVVAGASSAPIVSGGGVSVSLASNTAASTNLASCTAFNPVLTVNLTAGSQAAAVTGLKLKKSGFIGNTSISSIAVFDAAGVRHGNAASSINSDNEVNLIFTSDPINVPAGQTVTATIKVNITCGADASTIQLGLVSASSVTAGGAVSGSFPINGNLMNTVSSNGSIVSSTVDIKAVATNAQLSIDAVSQQDITKFNFAEIGGQEAMIVKSLTLYNNGNAAASDYSDVSLVAPDGTVLATAQPVGQYVTFSNLNYRIDKSMNRDLTVRAKILGGTSRTIQLVIYNDYDVTIQGENTGAYVVPTAGGVADSSFPIDGGAGTYNKVTVAPGTVSFGKDTTSPTASVAPGTSSVVLAKYYVKAAGEDMELRTISLGMTRYVASNLTGSVYVKVDGANVYSISAASISALAAGASSTLQSYPIIKAGVNSYITVEGNVSVNATSGEAFTARLNVNNVKRLSTNDIVDAGTVMANGNSIAVQSGVLKVTTLSTPVAQTTVNGNDFEFATFELNANNSGESVKVSSIVISDTLGAVASSSLSQITNLRLYQGTTLLETTNNTSANAASSTFTLKTPIVVTASAPVVLRLVANVTGSITGGSHTFRTGAVSSMVTAIGQLTGNTITPTFAGTGQTITLAESGSATMSLVSGSGASPSSDQSVNVGTTDGTYLAFKLTGSNEPIKVRSIVLKATSTLSSTLGINAIKNIRLYYKVGNGAMVATPFATAGQMDSCTLGVCTLTLTATDNLLPVTVGVSAADNVTIYVKTDIGGAGIAKLAENFRFYSTVTAVGAVSNASASVSGSAVTTAVTYVTPFNVSIAGVSPAAPTTVGLSGGTIGVFKVTNSGSAPITISTVKFTNSGSSSTTIAYLRLYSSADGGSQSDATVNASTTPVAGTQTADFGTITTNALTINGGSWRYLTVKYLGTAVNYDSFQLTANASAGDITYKVNETDLGYDANGSGTVTSADITGLIMSGNPTVETVTARN